MEKTIAPSREEMRKLIESIGGKARLFSILEKFYQVLSADIMVGYFFAGKDLNRIAQGQGHFILLAAGLIPAFEGKGPASAHHALPPILSGHFDRRLLLLEETLKEQGLNPSQISTWLQFEEAFRNLVVHKD
jgi:truncated hemoglobin YjbI